MYHVRTSLAVHNPDGSEHVRPVEEHDVAGLDEAQRWADWAHDMGMLADYNEVPATGGGGS